jgi:hypothetical protein
MRFWYPLRILNVKAVFLITPTLLRRSRSMERADVAV